MTTTCLEPVIPYIISTIIKTTAPDEKLFTTEDNIPDVLPRISPAFAFAFSIMFSELIFPCSSLFIKTDISIALFVLLSISDVTKVTPCSSIASLSSALSAIFLYTDTGILKRLKVSVNSLPINAAIRHTIRKIP